MEKNRDPVVSEVPESSGVGLDALDLGVQPFSHGVGDAMFEVG